MFRLSNDIVYFAVDIDKENIASQFFAIFFSLHLGICNLIGLSYADRRNHLQK